MAREATLNTRKAWLDLIPLVKIKLMHATGKFALHRDHGTMVVAWHFCANSMTGPNGHRIRQLQPLNVL
jgi:hypothetical protein